MSSLPCLPVVRVATEEDPWFHAHPGCRWHLTHRVDDVPVLRTLTVLSPSGATLATFILSDAALRSWAPVAVWFERLLQTSSQATFTEIAETPASGVRLVAFRDRSVP